MQLRLKYYGESISATIPVPGSKSISNRCLILQHLIAPHLILRNLSTAADTQDLINALIQIREHKNFYIDVGHAGTDMRFLTALLSIEKGEWILTGSDRMKERPVQPLVQALRVLGAEVTCLENEGFPPLRITGKKLEGGKITIEAGISSQFISALLLIAPILKSGLEITLQGSVVSLPYISMTMNLLREFGISVTTSGQTIIVKPLTHLATYPGKEYLIESDWTSASYWYSMVALSANGQVILKNFEQNSLQGDSVLPIIFKKLGVTSEFKNQTLVLSKSNNTLSSFEYDCTDCPDLAQTFAVTCLGLGLSCKLTGLSTLKNKETDRILALKTELEKFGVNVFISADSLEFVTQPAETKQSTPVNVKTYSDHRMAMSFAPLMLVFKEIHIQNPEVVNKSYPEFWEHLKLAGILMT